MGSMTRSVKQPPAPSPEDDGSNESLVPPGMIRDKLYPGEDAYFRANPHVAGMAAEDDSVILNPYAPASVNRKAVAVNEAARIVMRTGGPQPNFDLTDEQDRALRGTPYEHAAPEHRRATVAARILSGDPSGGTPTDPQQQFVAALRRAMRTRPR
jgi:hypothetical protein